MSLNLIERNAGKEAFEEAEKVDEKKAAKVKENGKKESKKKKGQKVKSFVQGSKDAIDENVTTKGTNQEKEFLENDIAQNGKRSPSTQLTPSQHTLETLPTLEKYEETPGDELLLEKSIEKSSNYQDLTSADAETMSFMKTSSSLCEPLNLYKDEHSQSMKLLLKKHKIIVNVSEIDDRIVIQTVSQNVQDNSDFNCEVSGPNNEVNNTYGRDEIGDIIDPERDTLPRAVRSKYDELVNEEIHLRRERAEELNMPFILMLFFITVTFLLLWLPSEVYNYSEMLTDANLTRLAYHTTDIYEFNRNNVFHLCKSLNGIFLFVFFYYLYKNFNIHFHASFDQITSICHSTNNNKK